MKGKTEEESDVRTAPVLPAIQGRGVGQPPFNLNLEFLKETLTEQFSRLYVNTNNKEAQYNIAFPLPQHIFFSLTRQLYVYQNKLS